MSYVNFPYFCRQIGSLRNNGITSRFNTFKNKINLDHKGTKAFPFFCPFMLEKFGTLDSQVYKALVGSYHNPNPNPAPPTPL